MNKTLMILIFVGLVLVGWFYWFQWRPANIRSECSRFHAVFSDGGYKKCLNEHGLED